MSFVEIVRSSRTAAVESLSQRAALYNRLAKNTPSPWARQRLYRLKSAALSRLVVLGAGTIHEVFLAEGLVTVALPNGRRLHCPISQLEPAARRVLEHTLLRACA